MSRTASDAGVGPSSWPPGCWPLFTGRGGGVSAAPYDTLNLGRSVGDDPAAVAANRRLAAGRAASAPTG